MVVCWKDDLKDAADRLPGVEVVALDGLADDLIANPLPPTLTGQKAAAARFDWRAAHLGETQRTVLARLREFGERQESGFRLVWPERDDAVKFSIVCDRHHEIGFGASALGTVGIPFGKWRGVSADVKALTIERLNSALPHMDFTQDARRKKGHDVERILPDSESVEKFLTAWKEIVAVLDDRRRSSVR